MVVVLVSKTYLLYLPVTNVLTIHSLLFVHLPGYCKLDSTEQYYLPDYQKYTKDLGSTIMIPSGTLPFALVYFMRKVFTFYHIPH